MFHALVVLVATVTEPPAKITIDVWATSHQECEAPQGCRVAGASLQHPNVGFGFSTFVLAYQLHGLQIARTLIGSSLQ